MPDDAILINVDNTTNYSDLQTQNGTFDIIIHPSANDELIGNIGKSRLRFLRTVYVKNSVSLQARSLLSKMVQSFKEADGSNNKLGIFDDGVSAFANLPLELIVLISSFLTPLDLAYLFLTNKKLKELFDQPIILNKVTLHTFNQFDHQDIIGFAKSRAHVKLQKTNKGNQIAYLLSSIRELKNQANAELIKAVKTYNKEISHNDEYPMLDKDQISKIIAFIQSGELTTTLKIYLGFMNQRLVSRVIFKHSKHFKGAVFDSSFEAHNGLCRVDININFTSICELVISGNFKLQEEFVSDGSRFEMGSSFELNKMFIKLPTFESNEKKGKINLLWLMRTYANKFLLRDLAKTGIQLTGLDELTSSIICDDPSAFFAACERMEIDPTLNTHIMYNGIDRGLHSAFLEARSYRIITEGMKRDRFHRLCPDLYWQAIRDGQLDMVKHYISQRPIPNTCYYNSKSRLGLLFYVVLCRQPQILECLLATLPDTQDIISHRRVGKRRTGETVLHMVIRAMMSETNIQVLQALFEMAQLLIEYGINKDIVNDKGKKALDALVSPLPKSCKLTAEQVNTLELATAKQVPVRQVIPSLKEQLIRQFYFTAFPSNNCEVSKADETECDELPASKREKLDPTAETDPRLSVNFLLGSSS